MTDLEDWDDEVHSLKFSEDNSSLSDSPADDAYLLDDKVPREDQIDALNEVSGRARIEWLRVDGNRLLPVLNGVPLVFPRFLDRFDYQRTESGWVAKYDVQGVGTVLISCSEGNPGESYLKVLG